MHRGFFIYPTTRPELGFDPDEALIELQAQFDKARGLGLDIRYADLHMNTVASRTWFA